jgi:hypothetical protein
MRHSTARLVLFYNLHTTFNDNEQTLHFDDILDLCEHNTMNLRKIGIESVSL